MSSLRDWKQCSNKEYLREFPKKRLAETESILKGPGVMRKVASRNTR
jgi:hypothetical protein